MHAPHSADSAAADPLRLRAHDLLFPATTHCYSTAPLPSWVDDHWLLHAPAVVRRAPPAEAGQIPVGLRGTLRSQRFATSMRQQAVLRVVTPEQLVQTQAWQQHAQWQHHAPIKALALLEKTLADWSWGITGSCGFSLASGICVLSTNSDLDLLIRLAQPPCPQATSALLKQLADLPCRCDIQIETPFGAFALLEWARGEARVLLKTPNGPRLTTDPWSPLDTGVAE
jgi:phosphoribosyl-dephospho-CoA transferase